MAQKSKAPPGASLVVMSSFFYASYGIWTKLMGNFFGGYTASALRSAVVLLMLLPLVLARHQFEPIKWRQTRWYLSGLFFFSLFIWGPLYYAILHAGIGISLTINYACIVIGMFFFGWLLNGESFTKDKVLSALLGIAGIALVFLQSAHHVGLLALIASAASGLATSVTMVISKQIPYGAAQSTFALWMASLAANIVMMIIVHEHIPPVGLHSQWLYLVCFGLASVIASWSVIKGMKLIDAGAAGVLGLLEIVFGVLFGVVFFSERPGMVVLLGVVAILVAAAIPYIKDYNASRGTLE